MPFDETVHRVIRIWRSGSGGRLGLEDTHLRRASLRPLYAVSSARPEPYGRSRWPTKTSTRSTGHTGRVSCRFDRHPKALTAALNTKPRDRLCHEEASRAAVALWRCAHDIVVCRCRSYRPSAALLSVPWGFAQQPNDESGIGRFCVLNLRYIRATIDFSGKAPPRQRADGVWDSANTPRFRYQSHDW
jgi:hypothetical protein